jgi:hypothetical protein
MQQFALQQYMQQRITQAIQAAGSHGKCLIVSSTICTSLVSTKVGPNQHNRSIIPTPASHSLIGVRN